MKGIRYIALFLASVIIYACGWIEDNKITQRDKVLILYSAGFNSLGPDLVDDINELSEGQLPAKDDKNAIVIVCHHTSSYKGYSIKTNPCIIQLYKGNDGKPVKDTLLKMDNTRLLTDSLVLRSSLNFIDATFKSKSYGMIYSSHASGWLPEFYYEDSEKYDAMGAKGSDGRMLAGRRQDGLHIHKEFVLPGPKVKSIGQEIERKDGSGTDYSHEMIIEDFARYIPFKLDYILFDACLMGGVEVAYSLREICGKVGFSQAEMLSDGLRYTTLASHLLKQGEPDIIAVAKEFFETYQSRTGDFQSATFSVIDCTRMEELANVCKLLFEKYREGIENVKPRNVQRYFRYDQHWFYDLRDMLVQSGMSEEDKAVFDTVLDKVVLYKAHTESFMPDSGGFRIYEFSGFSTFLPNNGSDYLKAYYKTLPWNQATELVR